MVGLGSLTTPTAALSMLGLLLIAALQARGVRGAMLVGILLTAAVAWVLGLAHFAPGAYSLSDLSATAFKLDIPAALNLKGGIGISLVEIVFVFLFVDLFDNVGTLVAVTKRAGLVAPDGTIPRLNRILLADSAAMLVGATVGTSPITSYIESAAGVAVGGRTGLTSIVVGLLFFCTLFFAPLGAGDPGRGHRAGLDPGGRPDDGGARGSRLGGPGRRHSRLSHRDHDSADLFDRQWPRLRHHQPRHLEAGARTGSMGRLAGLRAGRAVRGAVHLPGVIARYERNSREYCDSCSALAIGWRIAPTPMEPSGSVAAWSAMAGIDSIS